MYAFFHFFKIKTLPIPFHPQRGRSPSRGAGPRGGNVPEQLEQRRHRPDHQDGRPTLHRLGDSDIAETFLGFLQKTLRKYYINSYVKM